MAKYVQSYWVPSLEVPTNLLPIAQDPRRTSQIHSQADVPVGGRLSEPEHLHTRTGSSPRCRLTHSWVLAAIKPGVFDQEMDHIFWRGGALSWDAIKHFIGKGGHHSERLESLLGPFIRVFDSVKEGADVHIHGPCEGFAMVPMFWHACTSVLILFCLQFSWSCAKGSGREWIGPIMPQNYLHRV